MIYSSEQESRKKWTSKTKGPCPIRDSNGRIMIFQSGLSLDGWGKLSTKVGAWN